MLYIETLVLLFVALIGRNSIGIASALQYIIEVYSVAQQYVFQCSTKQIR